VRKELLDLKERIESELHSIQETGQRVVDAWDGAERFPDQQRYYLDSVALNLHSFYNGLERIFRIVARQLDPVFPSGAHWHRELLDQMAREIPEARPAVLSVETSVLLSDFLAFRHLIRGLYAFDLDAERLEQLVHSLAEALSRARQDLGNFCQLLSIAAQDTTETPNAS
jgi:hypothetical protein